MTSPLSAVRGTRIALRFGVFWLAGFALYGLLDQRLHPVNAATARTLAGGLRLLGFDARAAGQQVMWAGGARAFDIIDECTGVFGYLVFASVLLAVPARPSWRLLGLAGGVVAIALLNQLRLLALALVYTFAPASFPVVHEYLMQVLFMAAVVALFLLWLPRAGYAVGQ